MERHFLSRSAAIEYLVHRRTALSRGAGGASPDEGRTIRERIDVINQLILDLGAGRVDAFQAGKIEIFTTD